MCKIYIGPFLHSGFKDSIDNLIATDTELTIELAVQDSQVSDVNNTLSGHVDGLEAGLAILEEIVIQMGARVAQLEVSGKYFSFVN